MSRLIDGDAVMVAINSGMFDLRGDVPDIHVGHKPHRLTITCTKKEQDSILRTFATSHWCLSQDITGRTIRCQEEYEGDCGACMMDNIEWEVVPDEQN